MSRAMPTMPTIFPVASRSGTFEGPVRLGARERVADCADEQRRRDLPFHEVVLRSELDGLERQGFVVEPAQDNDWRDRCMLLELLEGLDAVAVGKREIAQHDID